jgi:hypothetical protein
MARAAAAEAAAARAAAAAVQPTLATEEEGETLVWSVRLPTGSFLTARRVLRRDGNGRAVEWSRPFQVGAACLEERVSSPQGEVGATLGLSVSCSEKNDEKSADTDTRPPKIYPTQAESSDSRDGTAEVRERMIRAVTAILNPLKNPPPLQERCVVTLHTLCKNVIDHPSDDRYRLVKATSRTMTQKVLCCVGGEQFLYAAGWTKVTVNYEGYYRCDTAADASATLRCAEDVLSKNLRLCREKAARHERLKTKEKDDAARQKQEAMRAIEEDKARRREAEERKRAAKASGASM